MPRHCLRPDQRLLSKADFQGVFRAPAAKAGRGDLLLLASANGREQHRLGLAIAKKHVPLAVRRNLIKRLAREHFRRLSPSQPAMDIVVLTRPAARRSPRAELNAGFKSLFARLGLEVVAP